MRTRQMWVQHLMNTARWQGGLLRAHDAKSDPQTDCSPEAAKRMANMGLLRYVGKDEHGRQLWQLREEQNA